MSRTSTPLAAALAVVLLDPGGALALPAAPFPIPLHNADGTVVMAADGDEHLSWAEDAEGFALAYDSLLGAWHYATLGPDGRLAPLPYRPGEADPNQLRLPRHLAPTADAARAALGRRPVPPKRIAPLGSVKNLVFLVKFNCASGCDASARNVTYQPASFLPVFNGASGSVKAFYSEVSYGALTLESVIADDAWIQLPHNDVYYVYNSDNPNGRPDLMIQDAVAELDAKYQSSGGFDFAQYDADGDGIIDAVDVIHVGPATRPPPTPASSTRTTASSPTPTEFTSLDGTRFVAYHTDPSCATAAASCRSAPSATRPPLLGAPDLYDYYGVSQAWPVEPDGGGRGAAPRRRTSPSHPDAYIKKMLGFFVPTLVASSGPQTLAPAETTPQALRSRPGCPARSTSWSRTAEDRLRPYLPPRARHLPRGRAKKEPEYSGRAGLGPQRWNLDPTTTCGPRAADGLRHSTSAMAPAATTATPATSTAGKTFAPPPPPTATLRRGHRQDLRRVHRQSAPASPSTWCSTRHRHRLGGSCVATASASPLLRRRRVLRPACDQACATPARGRRRQRQRPLRGDQRRLRRPQPCTDDDRCRQATCVASQGLRRGRVCTLAATATCPPALRGGGPVADSTACDDGDGCTRRPVPGGVCQSGDPTPCPPPDSCHEGSPATRHRRLRPLPLKANGTPCDDGDRCSGGDTCLAQVPGLHPRQLPAPTPATRPAPAIPRPASAPPPTPRGPTARPATTATPHRRRRCVAACARHAHRQRLRGRPCHAAGTCDPATGFAAVQRAPDGTPCDDQTTTPWATVPLGPVQGRARELDLVAGKPDGAGCDDLNVCTRSDMCLSGVCTGTNPKPCNRPPDGCHVAEGACDSQTGKCAYPARPDGASCDDGDPATDADRCEDGRCRGTPTVEPDECEGRADGEPCTGGECRSGACVSPTDPPPAPAGCGCASTPSSGGSALPFAVLLLSASMLRPRRRASSASPSSLLLPRVD
jgi:hypothetical protein